MSLIYFQLWIINKLITAMRYPIESCLKEWITIIYFYRAFTKEIYFKYLIFKTFLARCLNRVYFSTHFILHTDLGLTSGNITGIACINWFTDPINQSVIEFSISGQSIYIYIYKCTVSLIKNKLFKKFYIIICQGRRWIL